MRKIESGAIVCEHYCDTCREPAYFGFGVQLRKAMNAFVAGNMAQVKEFLGEWFCSMRCKNAFDKNN